MKKAAADAPVPVKRNGVPRPRGGASREQRLVAVRALGRLALPVADVGTLNREATADPKKLLP